MSRFKESQRCFIIAEAGSNHDGSFEQALELIAVAKRAGADAIKFQMFRAEKLYAENAGVSAYLGQDRSIVEIIRSMEMPLDWLPRLAAAARDAGLEFMVSAFDEESLREVDPHVAIHKCASYEMTHLPLVKQMAATGKPLIMSTGTAELSEVEISLDAARLAGATDIVLLQCTAAYPTPLHAANVRAMNALATLGVPVGLSDHTRDPVVAPSAAVALGARVIEKHFTLSNNLDGPDHAFALEPDELERLVVAVRSTEVALGDGEKRALPEETELRNFARRSIFTTKAIAEGEALSADNLAVLRSGSESPGLPPCKWDWVLGKTAKRELPKQIGLSGDDVRA